MSHLIKIYAVCKFSYGRLCAVNTQSHNNSYCSVGSDKTALKEQSYLGLHCLLRNFGLCIYEYYSKKLLSTNSEMNGKTCMQCSSRQV